MADPLEPPLVVLPNAKTLREGSGVRFRLRHFGIERDAFAIRYKGTVYAYLNACRHQSLPLDFGDAHFFDDVYDALVCCHHAARYRPETGECLDGPCEGGRLSALSVQERDGALVCLGASR
jgi:nitrite reductase/ring-hydroxylating ferredoxin subunit